MAREPVISGSRVRTAPGRRLDLATSRINAGSIADMNRDLQRSAFTPGMLRTDEGPIRDFTANDYSDPNIGRGMALKALGEEQINQRRRQMGELNREKLASGLVPSVADAMLARRPAGDPAGMDAFFGLMQAKENATRSAGMRLKWDPTDIGTTKVLDVPTGRTYNADAGEVAPGMRERPTEEYALQSGFNPRQRGFYTPSEMGEAAGGLERAFRQLRLRRR